jgi:hypothetical protein
MWDTSGVALQPWSLVPLSFDSEFVEVDSYPRIHHRDVDAKAFLYNDLWPGSRPVRLVPVHL